MELHAGHAVASGGGAEGDAVLGPPEDQPRVLRFDRVGVDEVERRLGRTLLGAGPERRAVAPLDPVPADLRELARGPEAAHRPRQHAEAARAGALLALREQQLQAEADAEYRPTGVDRLPHRAVEPLPRDPPHRLAEVPDARQDDGLGAVELARGADHPHPRAEPLERLGGAAQVAHLVVQDRDQGSRARRAHRNPLVEGTPPTRGLAATAAASARATALKQASIT